MSQLILPSELRGLIADYLPGNRAIRDLLNFSFGGRYFNGGEIQKRRNAAMRCNRVLQHFGIDGKIVEVQDEHLTMFKYQPGTRAVGQLANVLIQMMKQSFFWSFATTDSGMLEQVPMMNYILFNSNSMLRVIPQYQPVQHKFLFTLNTIC